MADVQFDLVPKFGDFNNSEPAKQGQVTINTYLDEGEYNRRVNDILRDETASTNIVYPYGKVAPTKKTFSVKENEPALMVKKDLSSVYKKDKKRDGPGFRGNWYNHKGLVPKRDTYARVFNSLTGMTLDLGARAKEKWDAMQEEEKKALIRSQFRVIGTIGTTYDYDSKIGMAYFPVRLAGTFAMRNGSKPVSAGQYLMVDAPKPNEKDNTNAWKRDPALQSLTDIPQDKVTMELVPFDPNHLPSLEVLEHYLDNPDEMKVKKGNIEKLLQFDALSKPADRLQVLNTIDRFLITSWDLLKALNFEEDDRDYRKRDNYKLFKDLIDSFFLVRCEQKSRIIGRALTDAEPGAQVDVYVTEGYGN